MGPEGSPSGIGSRWPIQAIRSCPSPPRRPLAELVDEWRPSPTVRRPGSRRGLTLEHLAARTSAQVTVRMPEGEQLPDNKPLSPGHRFRRSERCTAETVLVLDGRAQPECQWKRSFVSVDRARLCQSIAQRCVSPADGWSSRSGRATHMPLGPRKGKLGQPGRCRRCTDAASSADVDVTRVGASA
jgi:hypothetical protein